MLCADPSTDTPSFLVSPDGRVCWNREKDAQKWVWIRGRDGLQNPAPVIAPGRMQTLTHQVSPEGPASGDVEVCALMGTFTNDIPALARFGVILRDSRTKRQYMNAPAVSTHVYGVMTLPGGLGAPIYIPATQALLAEMTNIEALSAIPRVTVYGRRFVGPTAPMIEARRRAAFFSQRIQPYWLVPDTGPVVRLEPFGVAGDSQLIRMTVPGSAYFDALWLLDDSTGDYEVEVYEGTEMRSMMDGPVPRSHVLSEFVAGVAGNSSIGFAALRACRWTYGFSPTSQITFRVRNLTNAPNDIRISIHGRLVYVDSDHTPVLDAALRYMPTQPGPYANPAAGTCAPCDPMGYQPALTPTPGYLHYPGLQPQPAPYGVIRPGMSPIGIVPQNLPPLGPPNVPPWVGTVHSPAQAVPGMQTQQTAPLAIQHSPGYGSRLPSSSAPPVAYPVASPAALAYAQQYRAPAPGFPGGSVSPAQAAAQGGAGGTFGTVG